MGTLPLARVLLAMAAAHSCGYSQAHLTVAVYDYAEVPRPVLASAVDMARRGFLANRVASHWVICERENCAEKMAPGSFLELIVTPRLQPGKTGGLGRVAGFALHREIDRQRAYASYAAAREGAEWTLRPVELVLACILMHETGHLLGLGHQAHGVMHARLESDDMDDAVRGRAFSAAEGETLRAAANPTRRLQAVATR